jgi:hypothetical protein
MRYIRSPNFLFCVILFILSGCSTAIGGPQSWIDQPVYDPMQVPLEPLILQAHASDEDGVRNIVFWVGERQIASVDTGGNRLGNAIIEWTPPGPGSFSIQVFATDMAGNVGDTTTSLVIVEDQKPLASLIFPDEEIIDDDPIPDKEETESPPTAKPPPPQNTLPPPTVQPSPTQPLPTATLQSTISSPTSPAPPPPQPPPDTIPPNLSYVDIYPDYILTEGSGCTQYARIATSTVEAFDDSGIFRVFGDWVLGNQSGTVIYGVVDDSTFRGDYGPVGVTGTMFIQGGVIDNAGNTTPFTLQVTVGECIE